MAIREITDQNEYTNLWQQLNLHVLQSWAWGDVKKSEGWEIIRLGLEEAGELVMVLSLQLKKINTIKIKFAYLPKLIWPPEKIAVFSEELKNYTREKLGLDFVLLEFNQKAALLEPYLKEMAIHPYQIQPLHTNQVDLTVPDLWLQLKGNYRRNIQKSQKQGVSVQVLEQGEEAIEMFYQVMSEIFKNTSFLPRKKAYFSNLWQELSRAGLARIFLARQQDQIVGAYLVVYDNLGAYELYGGVTRSGRDVEAGYLLKFQAMQEAQKQGKKFYDHWGVAPRLADGSYEPGHELANISTFKEGFGGAYLEFPQVRALVINQPRYKIFRVLQAMNKLKVKLQKKA